MQLQQENFLKGKIKSIYPTMKLNRFISFFLGFISLTLPAFIYKFYIGWMGFPDGYITECERAEKILYRIFILPEIAFGLFFIYLGWTASKQRITRKLTASLALFILYLIVIIIVDGYLRLHLDNGRGG
jgi:hypothetical protein